MFRWHDLLEVHILAGLSLSLLSLILLILVTFSTPFIKSITFLTTPPPSSVSFGAFGYCTANEGCTPSSLGYTYHPELISWLTHTSILFGVAALLMLIAYVTLLASLLRRINRFGTLHVLFRTSAVLGSLMATLAFAFQMMLWANARQRFDEQGVRAKYGAAPWLAMVAAIAASLSVCVRGPQYSAPYMYRAHADVSYRL
ncbi:hypothetical protein P7C73_g63, partial [Tremellales sp. Uapishka_1]